MLIFACPADIVKVSDWHLSKLASHLDSVLGYELDWPKQAHSDYIDAEIGDGFKNVQTGTNQGVANGELWVNPALAIHEKAIAEFIAGVTDILPGTKP